MQRLITTILLLLLTNYSYCQYVTDILGNGYERLTMQLNNDDKGEVIATLVRKSQPNESQKAILYVHGYNDYFFQTEMAERFTDSLWNFYALDLRRYGRSMVTGRVPYEINDLSQYFEDIDAAIDQIKKEGNKDIVMIGHSTGGLITSLYCNHISTMANNPINALILNSPFFDMNMGWASENIGVPIISALGTYFDDFTVQEASDGIGTYAKSIHSDYSGEWNFDTSLKTLNSRRITSGWIRAIHEGHKIIQGDCDIKCPVLLMYSDKSTPEGATMEEFQSTDAVLDVDDIKKYGAKIGNDVTDIEIEGGMHDLVLSKPKVRENVYNEMFKFLKEVGL